jgi:hypothetical protein
MTNRRKFELAIIACAQYWNCTYSQAKRQVITILLDRIKK